MPENTDLTTDFSQPDIPIVKFQNATSVSTPKGYSHSVEIDLGNGKMIIISGQVPLDKQGNLVGKGNFAKQAEQVFLNIKSIIEEAGGTMDAIVKTGIYMTDLTQIETFRNVRNKFINLQNPPASTLVQVSKLFSDDWLLEIEATAIISKRL